MLLISDWEMQESFLVINYTKNFWATVAKIF